MRGCDSGGEREERSRRREVDCLRAVLKRVFWWMLVCVRYWEVFGGGQDHDEVLTFDLKVYRDCKKKLVLELDQFERQFGYATMKYIRMTVLQFCYFGGFY